MRRSIEAGAGFLALAFAFAGGASTAQEPPLIPQVSVDKQICFALYTTHNGVLKLTAQLYPLREGIGRDVMLDLKRGGQWKEVARTNVVEPGWTAPFRVENWDGGRDVPYRVRHGNTAQYEGVIRRDPSDKDTIVVAAFAGNEVLPDGAGDEPKADIVENIKKLKPDLLFFAGGQVSSRTNHLAHWLRFGRDFGAVIGQIPTVCIPGEDDVGQSSLWGAGGRKSAKASGEDGGYVAPAEYVNEVQRAQTSHLPDPSDPAPVEQGIGVYYTALTVGRVSFAIIEDRKFKSGPAGLVPQLGPRPGQVTTNAYDPESLDVPGAELLGDRQLRFLREWGVDWRGCEMKAVLSQALLCGGAQLYGRQDHRVYADLNSNGWPQTGRDKALAEMRRAFAIQIAGDQRVAMVVHQGIDAWNDASYSFGVPPITNDDPRWWAPTEPGKNRPQGAQEYLGEFLDGFGNKMNVLAVANPPQASADAGKPAGRAAGFGVIRFHKPTHEITFECWPRNQDIILAGARQFPGWPITIKQEDNYHREATANLPLVEIKGLADPMVQVMDDANGEMVCVLRLKGKDATFRPRVFRDGPHTIRVGEGDKQKVFPGVMPVRSGGPAKIVADFNPPPPPKPEKEEPKKKSRSRH